MSYRRVQSFIMRQNDSDYLIDLSNYLKYSLQHNVQVLFDIFSSVFSESVNHFS